jgi:hypothetical protein
MGTFSGVRQTRELAKNAALSHPLNVTQQADWVHDLIPQNQLSPWAKRQYLVKGGRAEQASHEAVDP